MSEPQHQDHEGRTERRSRVRRRSVYALVTVIALSVASLLLRPSHDGRGPEASAFSYSAIGHHGFVRWLTQLGVPNRVAADRPTRDLGPGDTLAIIAPDPCETDTRCYRFSYNIRRALDAGANVLVVLPRWEATEDRARKAIAGEVSELPRERIAEVLARTLIAAQFTEKPHEIEIIIEGEDWSEDPISALGTTPSPRTAARSSTPEDTWRLDLESVQVLSQKSDLNLVPIVSVAPGQEPLVARIADTRVFIMTDPTIFGNASLARADHADFIAWLLFEALDSKAIIIDETVHTHHEPPRIWDALFAMPLAPLSLHVLLLFGLTLWMASLPFRLPLDESGNRPRGSRALLASAAALLEEGAAGGEALLAYWEMTVRDVARAYSLAPDLVHDERIQRLQQLDSNAELGSAIRALDARVAGLRGLARRPRTQSKILAVAGDIHHFRSTYTHG